MSHNKQPNPKTTIPLGLPSPALSAGTPGTPPPIPQSYSASYSQSSQQNFESKSTESRNETQKSTTTKFTSSKSEASKTDHRDTQISLDDLYSSEWIKVRVIAQPDPHVLLRHPAIKVIIRRTLESVTNTIEEAITEQMKTFQKNLVEMISKTLEESVVKGYDDEVDQIPARSNPFTATHTDNLHLLAEKTHLHAADTLISPTPA